MEYNNIDFDLASSEVKHIPKYYIQIESDLNNNFYYCFSCVFFSFGWNDFQSDLIACVVYLN